MSETSDVPEPRPIDRYLDEMFDRLAGCGAAGRRALVEAEDHLRAAADTAIASGTPAGDAERTAVARFGHPARIAGQIRRVNRPPQIVSLISGGWLVTGLGLLVLATTFLVKALELGMLASRQLGLGICVIQVPNFPDEICTTAVQHSASRTTTGLSLLALAGMMLGVRWWAIRAGLLPTSSRFPLYIAGLFAGLAALMVVLRPTTTVGQEMDNRLFLNGALPSIGLHHSVFASGLALLTAGIAILWYRLQARRAST